ncbi:MAG: FG-GAP-like repeat-containing protein [bacterium]
MKDAMSFTLILSITVLALAGISLAVEPQFDTAVNYGVGDGPHSVFSADLDGDNDNDLAVANSHSNNVSILLNNGDGTFAPAVNYGPGDHPGSVFSADLDGDNDNDLAVANAWSNNVSILLNNGDGTFAAAVNYGAGDNPFSVFSADLDGDSDRDLAVANAHSNNVSILLNNGDGTFASAVNYGAGYFPTSVFSADLNGDKVNDLAVANFDNSDNVSILVNNGNGTFAPAVNYGVGDYPRSVFSSDLDSDGDFDLAVANSGSDNVSVLMNVIGSYAIEKSFTESTLFETLLGQNAVLDNVVVSGDFNSTLNFTNFEIVSITTGSFAGKGFSKGEWEATLGGISYTGDWKGALFLKPQEGKIYLKGATSGEISATVEGYLTETMPGSDTYDQYQATWKIGRLGGTITSATINLNGTVSYHSSSEFPATELYILQTNLEGNVYGDYIGSLSTVLTHLRVVEETNPYSGEGFSIISYVSESGAGEGWTYDNLVSPGRVELKGLFDNPLFGILTATLDESSLPRILFLDIERVDLGLPPMADLKVTIWGPGRASPGQTITYVIELRNDGIKTAENTTLIGIPPTLADIVQLTSPGMYDDVMHMIRWDFNNIPPKSIEYLSFQTELFWGLPMGTQLASQIWLFSKKEADSVFQHSTPGLTHEDKETLDPLWGLITYAIPSPWGEAISLAMVADVLSEGILIAALGRARIEYQVSPIYGNVQYWREMYKLLYKIKYSPEGLKNGWTTSDGELTFSPDMSINEIIRGLREHYNYTPTSIPEQTSTVEMTVAHDPNIKYGPEGNVQPGQTLNYEVEFENEGEGIAFGVYITDVLDEDVDDLTLSLGGEGTYNPSTRTITWFVGEVGPEEGGSFYFSVNVRGDAPVGTDIINFATVYFPSVPEITRTNAIVSIIPLPFGCVAGYVTANCPAPGTGLLGVGIDIFDGVGTLIDIAVTDANGYYEMCEILAGDYTFTIVTPLGYYVSPEVIATTIVGGDTVNVDFALTCVEITASPRTIGFWKHQVGVATGGKGSAQIDAATLCSYLDLIEAHFNGNAINQVIIYQPPISGSCDDKLQAAKELLNLKGNVGMTARAKQQLMALLLNVASGKLSQTEIISVDGATVTQAITYCDNLIDDPVGDHETAKTICDEINNNRQVAAGVIPLSIANIAYKQAEIPVTYGLTQNYPNPFNPITEISFALPIASEVKLQVFNVMGQVVATLADRHYEAGIHTVTWDGSDVASGVYLYRLEAGDYVESRKMILLK